jgi:cytochrome c oxidase assembly protein subunit 11
MASNPNRNRKTAAWASLIVLGMIGLTYASVPLYRLFCQITGFGGTTQQAEEPSDQVYAREMTVQFNADTNQELPWDFRPEQRKVTARVGENMLVFFRAKNTSPEATYGTATFNVTPPVAGQHFVKTQCFCFEEQKLEPGEEIEMPVSFYIDPGILKDKNLDNVTTLTLSYTFFPLPEAERAKQLSNAQSDAIKRKKL